MAGSMERRRLENEGSGSHLRILKMVADWTVLPPDQLTHTYTHNHDDQKYFRLLVKKINKKNK